MSRDSRLERCKARKVKAKQNKNKTRVSDAPINVDPERHVVTTRLRTGRPPSSSTRSDKALCWNSWTLENIR